MRSIQINANKRTLLLVLALLVVSIVSGYSQNCSGNQIAITLKNVSSPNPKTLEFDLFITNTGSSSLALAALQGAVVYDNRLIPAGASTEFSVVNEANGKFASLQTITTQNAKATNQLRWTQNPVSLSSGKTITLPHNQSVKFARFRLTSSIALATGFLSKLEPQLSTQRGMTKMLATVYCNENTNSIALTPKIINDSSLVSNSFMAQGIPNPFVENFSLQITSTSDNPVNVKVYNMLGKLIEERQIDSTSIENNALGHNYPSGVYTVIVSQNTTTQTVRMIKQ